MAAIWFVFKAEARRRWRPWLAVALLVTLVGGAVLASMAAARRTDRAYPSFVHRYGFDAVGYADGPVPQVSHLPEVLSAAALEGPLSGQPTCACSSPIDTADFGISIDQGAARPYVKLLSGQPLSSSDPRQALVSFPMAETYGLHIGSQITVPLYAPSQEQAYLEASTTYPKPLGPRVMLHVVGIEAGDGDFPDGQTPSYNLIVGPGFARAFGAHVAESVVYLVRLHGGTAGLARFSADVTTLQRAGFLGYQNVDSANSAVQAAIVPQGTGWWVLAALAALVGLVVIAQALSRQNRAESESYRSLVMLGMTKPQLTALAMLRTTLMALIGTAGAVLAAWAISPLTPLGEARIAEPATGLAFDAAALVWGAVGLVVVVVLLGVWPAFRASAHPARQ